MNSLPVDQTVVEDRDDAAVVHAAADACLLEEHAAALAVARVLRQQALDGDTTFEAAVPGRDRFDHLRHAAARNGSYEAITFGRGHGRDVSANLFRLRFLISGRARGFFTSRHVGAMQAPASTWRSRNL
jgi:hypothetical protein